MLLNGIQITWWHLPIKFTRVSPEPYEKFNVYRGSRNLHAGLSKAISLTNSCLRSFLHLSVTNMFSCIVYKGLRDDSIG